MATEMIIYDGMDDFNDNNSQVNDYHEKKPSSAGWMAFEFFATVSIG